jgi:hypothetical protein
VKFPQQNEPSQIEHPLAQLTLKAQKHALDVTVVTAHNGAMRARRRRSHLVLDAGRELLVRLAGPADRDELERLATLDSQAPLEGGALLAELDGTAVAALSLRDGRLIADPFVPTAAVADHLRLRASSIAASNRPAAPLRRLRRATPAAIRQP